MVRSRKKKTTGKGSTARDTAKKESTELETTAKKTTARETAEKEATALGRTVEKTTAVETAAAKLTAVGTTEKSMTGGETEKMSATGEATGGDVPREAVVEEAASPKTSEYPIKAPMNLKLKCLKCDRGMYRLKGFERHSLTHPSELCNCPRCKGCMNLHKVLAWKEGRLYNCRKCGEELEPPEDLKEHMKTHERTEPSWCALCRVRCRDDWSLKMHMRDQHPVPDKGTQKK